jgi:hypothetical protein
MKTPVTFQRNLQALFITEISIFALAATFAADTNEITANAAEKPEGVPEENWLPINRKDEGLDILLRVYQPDLEKMKTWQAPKAELVN